MPALPILPRTSFFAHLSKNIEFHKVVAKVIAVCVVGHVLGHGLNYASNPDIAALLTPYSWGTGVVIFVAMIIIFSAATVTVKHAYYEMFWVAHHFFIIFFAFLFAHGKVFYMWATVPVLIYLAERYFRVRNGRKRVFVRRVSWVEPVMSIEFCHEGKWKDFPFTEGQYLYLNCPMVSRHEWHPFTISSAVGDLTQKDGFVSCHIRVHPGGWTEKVKEMFDLMNPKGETPFDIQRIDPESGQAVSGKHFAWDAKTPLLCVAGPAAAPAQHYIDYNNVMIVGAGIGLTPCASIIRAVLKHKWRKGFTPNTLTFCWVVRQGELKSFGWFIQTLTNLEQQLLRDRESGAVPADKQIRIHVFVTGIKASDHTMPMVRRRGSVVYGAVWCCAA